MKIAFRFILLTSALMLLSADLSAQNDVYMRIRTESFQPVHLYMTISSSPELQDIAGQLQTQIIDDLENSGYFRVFIVTGTDSLRYAASFPTAETDPMQNLSRAIFEGHVKLQKNSIAFETTLRGLPDDYLIFSKKFTAALPSIRWMAHEIADEIIYTLTGQRGTSCTKIVYIDNSKNLNLMDYNGLGGRKLTNNKSLNLSPSWAPSGEKLAFINYIKNNPELMVFNFRSGAISRISKQKVMYSSPAWSPDGRKIAFTLTKDGNSEIYTCDAQGNNLKQLTRNAAIDTSPAWSPSGREIAFTSDRSGSPQIYIMDYGGFTTRRLTYDGNYNDSPVWSPRGDLIAFVSRGNNGFQIYSIDVYGENLQQLTDGWGSNENPSWSPDGSKLAFASNRDGKWDIYSLRADGSDLQRLTTDGGNTLPKWSPRLSREFRVD